jgi:hypothetical protein
VGVSGLSGWDCIHQQRPNGSLPAAVGQPPQFNGRKDMPREDKSKSELT